MLFIGMEFGGTYSYRNIVFILVIFSVILKGSLIWVDPLYLDDCLYSEMTEEQIEHPTIIPTFLGMETSWKPPLFFWLYAIPVKIIKVVTSDIDVIYKFPNIILGGFNILLVFLTLNRITDERKAFLTSILYAASILTIYTDVRVLMDTMNSTFIFLSLYFYLGERTSKNILLGAIMALCAALVKSVVAFLIPLIVIIDCIQKKRFGLLIAISLLAVPLGIALHYVILFVGAPELANEEFTYDVLGKLWRNEETNYGMNLIESFVPIIIFGHVLLALGLLGFIKFAKENWAMSAWITCGGIAMVGSHGMIWYLYPFVPVLAYFTIRILAFDFTTKKEKIDALFWIALLVIIIMNIAIGWIWYTQAMGSFLDAEKQLGINLVGKENVVFMGDYQPTITALSYKILNERIMYGSYNDFGWIIFMRNDSTATQASMTIDFSQNYSTVKYAVEEKNIAPLFWRQYLFRKTSNITRADYIFVALGGNYTGNSTIDWMNKMVLPNYKKVENSSESALFERNH